LKKRFFLMFLPVLLFSKNLGVEVGFSPDSFNKKFLDVFYEKDTPIKNLPTYTTLALGGWNGKYGSGFAAVGEGIKFGDKLFIKCDISLCYITHTTPHLSTHYQFKDRIRVGYNFNENYSLLFGFIHFSNGGIKKPNSGENFFVMWLTKKF